MSSLQVTLILYADDPSYTVSFPLGSVIAGGDPSAREFRGSCVLHKGNSVVQRGVLHVEGGQEVTAVCKFVHGEDLTRLKREATLYASPDHLKNLQGKYVPRFFGYYEGLVTMYGRELTMGCTILEDCGQRVTHAELVQDAIKRRIIHSLLWLHHNGHVLHGDIEDDFRHVLINKADNSVRIIDFDRSAAHKCLQTGAIDMYDYDPGLGAVNCDELYDFFWRIGAWTPDTIRFARRPIRIFRAPTVRRLMKVANYFFPEDDNSHLEPKAKRILDAYYRNYGSRFPTIGHPLQLKMPLNLPGLPDSDDEDEDEKMPPFYRPLEWKSVTLETPCTT